MAQMMDPTSDFMNEEDIYNFFRQLSFIINDTEHQYFHVVRWIKDGNIFRIVDAEKFYKEVCPIIWKGCTREYFEYVIYACDFELVSSEFLDFRNSDFVEADYERLKNIKPKTPVLALRAFLELIKTSRTKENSDHQISSTSRENSLSDVGVSELRNTDERSNLQLSSTASKDSPSEDEASTLKNADGNSNNQISSTSGENSQSDIVEAYALKNPKGNSNELISISESFSPSKIRETVLKKLKQILVQIDELSLLLEKLIDVETNELKYTDENSDNQISSTLEKDSPSDVVEAFALKNTEENSNQQLSSTAGKDLLEAVEASEEKNTDENSDNQISSTLGKDSPSDVEACALKNAEVKSKKQLSSTSEKDLSLEIEASVLKNTDENSNLQRSFTSEKDASSDVGASSASASDKLLKQPSVEEHPNIVKASVWDPLTDEMSQEDIYSFVKELWNIISDYEFQDVSVVRWIKGGRVFRIMNSVKFNEEVCPKLWEGCTSDYFEYLLLACDFDSIPPDYLSFYNTDFLEEQSEKLKDIKPKKSVLTPKAFSELSRGYLKTTVPEDQEQLESSEEEPDTADLKNRPSEEKAMIYIDLLAEAAKSTKTVPNTLGACALPLPSNLNLNQETDGDYSPVSSLSSPEDFVTSENYNPSSAEAPAPSCSDVGSPVPGPTCSRAKSPTQKI